MNAKGKINTNLMWKRVGAALLCLLLVVTAWLPAGAREVRADAEEENMEVGVSVEGSANGPYNITITAQQLLQDGPGGQWGAETTLYFRVNNIVKLPAASAITASDSSVEITRNSDYDLTIKGYNYSTHVGQPLTITITGATLNTDSGSLIGINEAADMYLLSNQQTYIWRDGHDYHFVADGPVTVPVVWYSGSGPTPVWDGKKASWEAEAFDSATSYDVKLIGPGNTTLVETNTTALEQDFSSYITKSGRYRVNVWAKYGTDVKSVTPGFADKTWYEVKVAPAFKDIGESYYEAGTTGGTVAGTATSGDTFTTGENGAISGLFAVGDKIKITPTAAEGYTFEKFENYFDGSSYVEKTDNPLEFTLDYPQPGLAAFFVQDEPDPVTVILEVGEGHEGLAEKISDAAEAKGYEPTLSGTTLTMANFPVTDDYGDAVTVNSGANSVIHDLLLTAFGDAFSRWMDNGEAYLSTALNTIDNYDSMNAIYEELDAATDAIASNQKYYLLWAEPVSKVDLTIEKPICGTKVIQNLYEDVFENRPVVTASDDSDVVIGQFSNYWVGEDGMVPITEMDIEGGEDYTAQEALKPKFGFFIDGNNLPEVTVTNAKSTGLDDLYLGVITITVTADHDWDEGTETTPATFDKDGVMTYKCKHFDTCGGTKTEIIPKLEPITVTLIPSTMDGSEIGDPIVLTIPKGESMDSYTATDGRYKALVEQLKNMNEGYYPYSGSVYVTDKPYSEYSSEDDVDDADDEFFYKALTENTTFYVPMDKFIEELDVTVERPMAGTQVDVQTDDGHVQDGAKGLPTTTISDDKVAKHYELPYWVTEDITEVDYDKPFNGTIQAREDYKVLIQLEPKLGWAFKYLYDPAYVTINGKAVDTVLFSAHYYHDILGTVPSDFTYNLYVGGVHVTDSNKDDVLGDGTVKFDPENVKLTLNNADIEVSRREDSDDGNEYGIRSNLGDGMAEYKDKPLTIELIGANTISDSNNDEGTTNKYGIYVASSGPVTYTGGGTLNVNMKDANTAQRYLGLEHHQSITVDGVDINIDIDGTSNGINGIYMLYTNTLKLANGANVAIDAAKGYAFDNDVHTNNNDLDVTEGCTFEAVSGGENGALHGSGWIQLTDATKALGVMVNEASTASGRKLWDGETNLREYQYVRIPGIPSVTVNYDLGEGHEELAQADALKEAINKRHAMEVIGVEGSVVKIRVPELSDNNTKNTVARLLGALQVALNESVGHDPWYGPYWVYDQDQWNFNNALKTLENYSSFDDVNDEHDAAYKNGTMPEDGQTIYALWAEPISEVAIDVEAPLCGTEVTADLRDPENPDMGYDEETQTPQPVVSVSTEHVSIYEEDGWEYTWWVDQTRKEEAGFTILPPCYTGTMVGDKDYMMVVTMEPDFGYYLPEDVKFTTSNGTVDEKLSHGIDSFADAFITLTAEHKEGEPVEENRVEPTCTEAGSYDEVIYCVNHDTCGKEFSRETKTIEALGHDWGEWTVTKEPTAEAEGEETRECKRCGEKETRPIKKLDPEASGTYRVVTGNGSVWTKGSTATCDFTFKRSVNDEETFGHFTGIEVDGKPVGKESYTAEAGSVIVKLKPAYLETLSAGEHTLTALFDDGNDVTVKFTIKGKESLKPTPASPSKKSKAAPKTGDETNVALWMLMLCTAALGASFVLASRRRRR